MYDPCTPPLFDEAFREDLDRLFAWRRDVRRFTDAPVPRDLLDRLLDAAQLAPSVGNSQPWRFVEVVSPAARAGVRQSFERCQADALAGYGGERAERYAGLKLAGLDEAPVQLAVFCDEDTAQGHGLGRATMAQTLVFSVVGAVHTLWLAARAHGIGLGWVSILEPEDVTRLLAVPPAFRLIAYLCLGWPAQEGRTPELERAGWQARTSAGRVVIRR